ncbi:MAG: hypothetical protein ACRELG_13680 [Gemmataceae bacterium]
MERIMKRRTLPPRRRRRLAWVMPMTRDTRGMAEYAVEWLSHLSERFDIELITNSDPIEAPETLTRRHLILTAQEVAARHAALPYDLFLYLMPPPEHRDMLDLLRRFPGLVVLPDFSLTALRCLLESKWLSSQVSDDSREDEFTPILGVLVHSTAAWQQLRRALNVPVIHLELPGPLSPGQDAANEQVAAYASWIDLAIHRYEQSDGLWRGFVVQCLANHGAAEAGAILDSWTSLRALGQQPLAA